MHISLTRSNAGSLAKAVGSAASSQVTSRPALAILGVLLGALTSLFTSRLLSVGLADVQGAIGASSDEMSWLVTAYNAASMFIGPLTVFLGGLFGPRRVLLWASVIFMIAEFLSPLCAGNMAVLILLQTIAGLAAGTYYPLTITLIVRNLPLGLLYLGVAAYSLDILAATHITTLLAAWYVSHLSWRWIFWNALLVTPVLMACIYFGVPRQPMPERGPKTNLWGFLYASVAFTLLYIGLDQGERLDWFNSGVIIAFFVTGALLIPVAIIRHLQHPHPLLNLRFLTTRNFLLLGAVLVFFRFLLLGPTLLVPTFLGLMHNYRPDQTGQVLAWIAGVELAAAPLAGLILYKADSRLICAIGFFLVGISCLMCRSIDPSWTAETFVPSQVIIAAGLAFALTGLVTTIFRTAVGLGALQSPINILTISCWFQTCRLFGAELGKAVMQRFLQVRATYNYLVVGQHLDGGWLTEERLRSVIGQVFGGGSGMDDARTRALDVVGNTLKQQIGMLAISDGFVLIALCCAACLVVLSFLTYGPPLLEPKKASGGP
jgi:DHA2 family multidrug resistance protein